LISIAKNFKNSFFNLSKYDEHQKAIAVGRAGNVIGGGDWSRDRLIPDIVKALHSNKNVSIRNPAAIRPWQHVIEPLFGYLELGLKLTTDPMKYAEAYNFGPNKIDTLSVEEMVIKSISCWKSGTYTIEINNNNLHEAGLLMLDISKAKDELNWKPILSAEEAIERTINWYRGYYDGRNASELVKEDLDFFYQKMILENRGN
jgi:CDP-glucose 4,6-dehydratase